MKLIPLNFATHTDPPPGDAIEADGGRFVGSVVVVVVLVVDGVVVDVVLVVVDKVVDVVVADGCVVLVEPDGAVVEVAEGAVVVVGFPVEGGFSLPEPPPPDVSLPASVSPDSPESPPGASDTTEVAEASAVASSVVSVDDVHDETMSDIAIPNTTRSMTRAAEGFEYNQLITVGTSRSAGYRRFQIAHPKRDRDHDDRNARSSMVENSALVRVSRGAYVPSGRPTVIPSSLSLVTHLEYHLLTGTSLNGGSVGTGGSG